MNKVLKGLERYEGEYDRIFHIWVNFPLMKKKHSY